MVGVRRQSEQLFLDVIERRIRLGAFDVPHPWLGLAAIGGMGIRVAEWWDDRGVGVGERGEVIRFEVDDVARTYAEFAVRLLTRRAKGRRHPRSS